MLLKTEYHGMSNSFGGDAPKISVPQEKQLEDNTNDLYLGDLSDRDRAWDKHRANADKIANYYRGTEEFHQYATRIDFCSQILDFRLVPEDHEYKLKLYAARFCRVKHCTVCQFRRSMMWKSKAFKMLPLVVKAYPKYRWLFLTLTVRNCAITDLRDTLQCMNQSWRRMNQRKKFPAIGWLRSTEVTRSKDGTAHPHFHCLLLVKPSYFSGQSYMRQKEWVEFWRDCLKVDYNPILDIRPVKRGHQPMELVPEILKYCVKESDLVADRQWFLELTRQMHKVRTIATGGVLKEYLRQLEEEPEDLIGKDENKTENELDEGHLYFGWEYLKKRYQIK